MRAEDSCLTSFTESVMELIPDAVAVLDDQLRIRASNATWQKAFDAMANDSTLLLTPALHPLLETPIMHDGVSKPLHEALRALLGTSSELDVDDLEVRDRDRARTMHYSVRATAWRSHDSENRRIVLLLRQSDKPTIIHLTTPQELSEPFERRVDDLVTALDLINDFDSLCVEVLEMALRVSGGGSGSLMLISENNRELSVVASRGIAGLAGRKTTQPIGEGIAGRVAETGKPLLLVGRVGDERFHGVGGRPAINSSLCVPLKVEHKVLGVLNVNSKIDSEPFDDAVLDRISRLALRLGEVLLRSQQFQAMRRRSLELTVRAEIEAVAFSESTLEEKLRQVIPPIERLLNVDTCAIYLWDPGRRQLRLTATCGMRVKPGSEVSFEEGVGLPGWVARHQRTLFLVGMDDASGASDAVGVATVAAPVRHDQSLIGVVVLERSSGVPNLIELGETVQSVASALAFVIRDARSQDDSKTKLLMLSALSEMGVALAEAEDRTSFGKVTAYCAATILECEIAFVRLAGETESGDVDSSRSLDLLASHGTLPPAENDPLWALEDRLIARVMQSRTAFTDSDMPTGEIRPLLEAAGLRTALCVPLVAGNSVIGAITAYNSSRHAPPDAASREQARDLGCRLGAYASAVAQRFVAPAAVWEASNSL
jgi:GAF domain-containing protein